MDSKALHRLCRKQLEEGCEWEGEAERRGENYAFVVNNRPRLAPSAIVII